MNLFTISFISFRSLQQSRLLFISVCLGFFLMIPTLGVSTNTEMTTGLDLLHNSKTFKKELENQWGIELTALRMTAANHMVDFRYRVLDAEKAAPLFDRKTKPYLIHQASGKVLAVPNTAKVGSLRNSNKPKQGRIYWMFFGNKGLVKAGDKVSVVIGDFRAENLIID